MQTTPAHGQAELLAGPAAFRFLRLLENRGWAVEGYVTVVNWRVFTHCRSGVWRALVAAGILAALLASTGILFLAGGADGQFSSLPHLYYIPILVAALSFGPTAGVLAALAAALLGGPMMPANVALQTMQPATDLLTRSILFVFIGATTGGLTAQLRTALRAEQRRRQQLDTKNVRQMDQLRQFGHETLAAFTEAMARRDLYTGGHVNRVTGYATLIARHLEVPPEEIDAIRYAAHLHDVGKLAIPTEILRKPGFLNRQEWDVVRQHPVAGSQILERISVLRDAAPLVRHHHERYDGTGYPAGLRGEEIPLGARIIAVVDAFDAMVSDRPYRNAIPEREAIRELKGGAGTQFDPAIVRRFLEILQGHADDIYLGGWAVTEPRLSAHETLIADVVNHNGHCHVDVE